jgi:hypothetical protein
MNQHKRPSIYLQERCVELARVLDFFLETQGGRIPAIDERLVVFLTQLGFWEWELDNLIYAFTSFEERSRAWENDSGPSMAESLRMRGIPVRFSAVKNIRVKRRARAERVRQVVAPVEELNRVINMWNRLLDVCEERVLLPADERNRAADLGANVLPDLVRFRKVPLPAPVDV